MRFSVLMSVYDKEEPARLEQSLDSIWTHQTLRPEQIVVVKDGLLNDDLERVLAEWKSRLGEILTLVSLKKNVGLGLALNHGLLACRNEMVARMDSDDIALPGRFDKQIAFILEHEADVVGSWVTEFDPKSKEIYAIRRVPTDHKTIVSYAKRRNPMNHPTVVFKKSSVMSVGGYIDFPGFEDYDLWVRLLLKGYKLANVDESLVMMRGGFEQFQRRRGLSYVRREFLFQKHLLRSGFINITDFALNTSIRLPVRLLPMSFFRFIHKLSRL